METKSQGHNAYQSCAHPGMEKAHECTPHFHTNTLKIAQWCVVHIGGCLEDTLFPAAFLFYFLFPKTLCLVSPEWSSPKQEPALRTLIPGATSWKSQSNLQNCSRDHQVSRDKKISELKGIPMNVSDNLREPDLPVEKPKAKQTGSKIT